MLPLLLSCLSATSFAAPDPVYRLFEGPAAAPDAPLPTGVLFRVVHEQAAPKWEVSGTGRFPGCPGDAPLVPERFGPGCDEATDGERFLVVEELARVGELTVTRSASHGCAYRCWRGDAWQITDAHGDPVGALDLVTADSYLAALKASPWFVNQELLAAAASLEDLDALGARPIAEWGIAPASWDPETGRLTIQALYPEAMPDSTFVYTPIHLEVSPTSYFRAQLEHTEFLYPERREILSAGYTPGFGVFRAIEREGPWAEVYCAPESASALKLGIDGYTRPSCDARRTHGAAKGLYGLEASVISQVGPVLTIALRIWTPAEDATILHTVDLRTGAPYRFSSSIWPGQAALGYDEATGELTVVDQRGSVDVVPAALELEPWWPEATWATLEDLPVGQ